MRTQPTRHDCRVDPASVSPEDDLEEATISALLNLGYPRSQAQKVVRSARQTLGEEVDLEALVRESLRAAAR